MHVSSILSAFMVAGLILFLPYPLFVVAWVAGVIMGLGYAMRYAFAPANLHPAVNFISYGIPIWMLLAVIVYSIL